MNLEIGNILHCKKLKYTKGFVLNVGDRVRVKRYDPDGLPNDASYVCVKLVNDDS